MSTETAGTSPATESVSKERKKPSSYGQTPGMVHFWLRRLHSLMGLLFGGYVTIHLLVNFTGFWPKTFQQNVDKIHSLEPALPIIELIAIFIPLAFHVGYGIYIAKAGVKFNTTLYNYGGNIRHLLQRITAFILLAFLVYHIGTLHKWGFVLLNNFVPTPQVAKDKAKELEGLQAPWEKSKKDRDELRTSRDEMSKSLEELKAKTETLKSIVDAQAAGLAGLKGVFDTASAKEEGKRSEAEKKVVSQYNQLNAKHAELAKQYEKDEGELSSLTEQYNMVKQEYNEASSNYRKLNDQYIAVRKERDAALAGAKIYPAPDFEPRNAAYQSAASAIKTPYWKDVPKLDKKGNVVKNAKGEVETEQVPDNVKNTIVIIAYLLGIWAAVFHFANGLWTAAIAWGLTVTARAQKMWGHVCLGFGIFMLVIGTGAWVAFAIVSDPKLDYDVTRTLPDEPESGH